MKISIGCDHAGLLYKKEIIRLLTTKGHDISDYGTNTEDSVDYPDFIHPVAQDVSAQNSDLGIIICGSGNGAAMTANKHKNIRAAQCYNIKSTKLSRLHNDANIITLGSRLISKKNALKFVSIFLNTNFDGGRHLKRVKKI